MPIFNYRPGYRDEAARAGLRVISWKRQCAQCANNAAEKYALPANRPNLLQCRSALQGFFDAVLLQRLHAIADRLVA